MHHALMAPTTGKQLELEIVAASLTRRQVSDLLGIHRNTLRAILQASLVRPEQASAVRDAIARLTKAAA